MRDSEASADRPGPSELYADLEPHLSAPRLAPYLAATGGNRRRAISLYQWNVELSGAIYEALHVFEVVLRNGIDRALTDWNAIQIDTATGEPYGSEWLLDPAPLLRRILRDDLAKATARAGSLAGSFRRVTRHEDVLPQLTLGTWRYMLPDRSAAKRALWHEALRHAFPHLTRPEPQLVADVDSLYRLRNRVAHLETILDMAKTNRRVGAIRQTLRDIDPRAEQWFVSQQRVTSVLRNRPPQ